MVTVPLSCSVWVSLPLWHRSYHHKHNSLSLAQRWCFWHWRVPKWHTSKGWENWVSGGVKVCSLSAARSPFFFFLSLISAVSLSLSFCLSTSTHASSPVVLCLLSRLPYFSLLFSTHYFTPFSSLSFPVRLPNCRDFSVSRQCRFIRNRSKPANIGLIKKAVHSFTA